jgi:hypothetical protein
MEVFLSHSTKDKEFVQKLAALIGVGFEAWLCEVDLDWGDNFVSKVEDGLAPRRQLTDPSAFSVKRPGNPPNLSRVYILLPHEESP